MDQETEPCPEKVLFQFPKEFILSDVDDNKILNGLYNHWANISLFVIEKENISSDLLTSIWEGAKNETFKITQDENINDSPEKR